MRCGSSIIALQSEPRRVVRIRAEGSSGGDEIGAFDGD